MKQFRQAFLFLLIIALVGCKKIPTFPTAPEITFVGLKKITVDRGAQSDKDSVVITLGFKDGDGDLGTSDNTKINYFVDVYGKLEGKFQKVITNDTVPIRYLNRNGTFFSLNPDGRQGPLEGTLKYGISSYVNFKPYSDSAKYTLKFNVYIKDNAGNKSNEIETSEVEITNYL